MPKWRKTTVYGQIWGFYGGFCRSICVRRCAFAFVGRKKGLFSAFGGWGCVLVWSGRVAWLLGAFLRERGRGAPAPIIFGSCRWRCYPIPNREKIFLGNPWYGVVLRDLYIIPIPRLRKKFLAKIREEAPWGIYILYTHPFREQKFFYKTKWYCITRAIWRLYIKRTCEIGDIYPMAPTRFPKNGKMAAKTIRQNRQCKSCGNIANLAMR